MRGISIKTLCSGKEFYVRRELEGYMERVHGLDPRKCFLYVTSRVGRGLQDLSFADPYMTFVRDFLVVNNKIDEFEMECLASFNRSIKEDIKALAGSDYERLKTYVGLYYLYGKGMQYILENYDDSLMGVKNAILEYRRLLNAAVEIHHYDLSCNENETSLFRLNIPRNVRNVLFNRGFRSVEQVNLELYMRDTLIGLKDFQICELQAALKNQDIA